MTKRLLLLVLVGSSLLPARDFLGIVPYGRPELLARDFSVLGGFGDGILVLANESRDDALLAQGGERLDWVPLQSDPSPYYRVRLLDREHAEVLASLTRVLTRAGDEYLVRLEPGAITSLHGLGASLSRVSLRPLVLNDRAAFFPPVTRNPTIEMMVSAVSPDSVLAAVRRLQRYRARYSTTDSCRAACNWTMAKFQAYGCDSVYLQTHTSGHAPNVVGIKYGTAGTRQPYSIIDGHIDSYAASNAPGADDNASGTVAAIEACRVMKDYEFQHDIRFIAFTGEEFGLYGSDYYANQARSAGDSILGVFNFDMIGYVDVAPESLELVTKTSNPPCGPFSDFFAACADTYTTLLTQKLMVSDNQNSDHGPFWNNGYLAFCGIEDFWPENPHYHTSHDSVGAGYNSNAFCTEVIRAGVAGLATISEPVPMNVPAVGYLRSRIDDASGNNNGKWDAGESIAVYLTLKNFGMVQAHNVNASISTSDPYVTLYQTSAGFGNINGQDTALQTTPYTCKAAVGTPREHMVTFNLTIAATETTWNTTFSLQVGEYLITDPVPDGPRQPPLYWAYDDVDVGYPQHPTYAWAEINASGTRLSYPQNDDVVMIALPSQFGPLKFYGQRYTQLSISADGWLCPGNYTTPDYSNTGLPDAGSPPGMICLNWDDLYPEYNSRGYVYWYHDAANHRLIVEYDSVAYYSPNSLRDKFEVFIYDTTVVTPSGDNAIVAQYMTANGFSSSTVGIEDPTRQIAVQNYYNGALAHGAAPIAARRAIRYVTDTPTAIAESEPRLTGNLTVSPIPVSQQALVQFALPKAGRADVGIYDGTGRLVRKLTEGRRAAGVHALRWNAGDLPGGVYFVRLEANGEVLTQKTVVARE